MSESETPSDVAALTVQLLSAYLANNTVASEDLAGLIKTTRAALVDEVAPEAAEPEAPTYAPAVSVRKSLASPDHIISLIDGKPYKTLKRHLSTHGLTPESYRERYKLPASYPMVAPSFAAHRRAIAEKIGLGNRRRVAVEAPKDAPAAPAPVAAETTAKPAPVAASKPKKASVSKPKAVPTPAVDTAPAKVPAKAPAKKAKAAPKPAVAAPKPAPAPAKAAAASESAPAVKAPAKKAKAAPSGDAPAPKRRPRMAREPKPATT